MRLSKLYRSTYNRAAAGNLRCAARHDTRFSGTADTAGIRKARKRVSDSRVTGTETRAVAETGTGAGAGTETGTGMGTTNRTIIERGCAGGKRARQSATS